MALAALVAAVSAPADGPPSPPAGDDSDPGIVSPKKAAADLRTAVPGPLEPSESLGRGIDPTVEPDRGRLLIDGSIAEGAIKRDPAGGFTLATGAGRLQAAPTRIDPGASTANSVAGHDAALFANTAPSTDTVVRPTPTGVETFTQLRDDSAPKESSWRVSLPGHETLQQLPKGGVAVLAPPDQTQAELSSSARAPRNPAALDADPLTSDAVGGAYSPTIPRGKRIVAVVTAPAAVDSNGNAVESSLTARGDTITLTMRPDDTAAYPVVADPMWLPAGPMRNGWWSYGASEPLRNSRFFFAGRPTADGGCAYWEGTTVAAGAVVTRELAVYRGTCLKLMESGYAYPDLERRIASASAQYGSSLDAARRLAKKQGTYKNNQEDPAQIDVNEVSDTIRWAYSSNCVHGARGYDHTHEYHKTGWRRVGYNQVPFERRCSEATESTYAKFRGGQYFPLCFGSKVTTFYANNIAQAFPKGKFRGRVYRRTGGAPCHRLLHWESHTWVHPVN